MNPRGIPCILLGSVTEKASQLVFKDVHLIFHLLKGLQETTPDRYECSSGNVKLKLEGDVFLFLLPFVLIIVVTYLLIK